jgi:hypothetical protein
MKAGKLLIVAVLVVAIGAPIAGFVGDIKLPLSTIPSGEPIAFFHGPATVARGELPPEREELDNLDRTAWESGSNGQQDPWVKQQLLPFEILTASEVVIFATSSFGGMRAIGELCSAWAKREKRGNHGQPIVRLRSDEMPTKNFGKVPCPKFEIAGWNDTGSDDFGAPPPVVSEEEFEHQMPY